MSPVGFVNNRIDNSLICLLKGGVVRLGWCGKSCVPRYLVGFSNDFSEFGRVDMSGGEGVGRGDVRGLRDLRAFVGGEFGG